VGGGPHRRRQQVAGELRRVRAAGGGAGARRGGVRRGGQRALLEESVDGPGDTEGPQDLVAAGADVDPREGDGQVDDPGRPGGLALDAVRADERVEDGEGQAVDLAGEGAER